MKIEIILKDGRFLVNGKRLQDLSDVESGFMNDFFREVKLNTEKCTEYQPT